MPVIGGMYGTDKSNLYRVWEKYYDDMGLSYNKKMTKVFQRVAKGKFPNK